MMTKSNDLFSDFKNINFSMLEESVENARQDFKKIEAQNKQDYRKEIIIYQKLIQMTAELVPCLSVNQNLFCYSMVLSRLIHEGVLSFNNVFKIGGSSFFDIIGYLGMDVINGEALCRHVADFHHDVFLKLATSESRLSCYMNLNNTEEKAFFNHIVNFIEDGENYYIHDVLNCVFYKFENSFSMTPIYSYAHLIPTISFLPYIIENIAIRRNQSNMHLYYHFLGDIWLTDSSFKEVSEKFKKFQNYSEQDSYSSINFYQTTHQIFTYFNKRQLIIDDFIHDSKQLVNELRVLI